MGLMCWIPRTCGKIQSLYRQIDRGQPVYRTIMERKIFWLTFTALGLLADFVLPLWWALGATIPIFALSWWIAYRSEWF
jgi:hypothetical protein